MFFLTNIINKNILWVYDTFNASIYIFPRLDNLIDFFSVSTPGTTPKATSKKQQLAEKKTTTSTKKQQSNKKSVKNNNPSSKSSIAAAAALADANDPLNTSTGYHDLEDVETWVCSSEFYFSVGYDTILSVQYLPTVCLDLFKSC